MNQRDIARAEALKIALSRYHESKGILPGLQIDGRADALALQFVDSLRRIEFANYIRDAQHSPARLDPSSELFDPLRAAVLRNRRGETDEAWWLVFLATHFGKHAIDGWELTRSIYGKLGQGGLWDWSAIAADPPSFQTWLAANETTLRGADGISRRFSNHRKYESLKASSAAGTGAIFASYVDWVSPPRTHTELVREIHRKVGQDPHTVFAALFRAMEAVRRFGRLGKFDFLAMLGKLGIAPIEPGSTFLQGATGPLAGARLLFETQDRIFSVDELENMLVLLGREIGLGSQVLEDAICNWQKNPSKYIRFKG